MNSYRKSLPPLDTLVFFEAAMRHLNFTEAADELFVTQAAVSKRVRQLEDWLGVDLFLRTGRSLMPTEAGRYLAEKTGMTLEFLDQALRAIRVPGQSAIRLAGMTAVTTFWLQPRLKDYALSDEAALFNLVMSDDPGDLLRPDHDLTIVYGDGRFPGWHSELLFDEIMVPVISPEIVEAARDIGRAGGPPLLDYARIGPDWIAWDSWTQQTERSDLFSGPRVVCASYTQSIGRALKGQGIALGALSLLAAEIAAGELVPFGNDALATGRGYYIAWPDTRPLGQAADRLKRFLLESW